VSRYKHLDKVILFFKQQKPGVILLQEVLLEDVPRLEKDLNMLSAFAEMKIKLKGEEKSSLGIATFSSYPMKAHMNYYRGDPKNIPVSYGGDSLSIARAILVTEIIKNKKIFRLINTHFTWTPNGEANKFQYEDLPKFLQLLSQYDEFVLCGDLNAPRGKVIFDKIS
jgi:exonuclease III